MKKNFVFTATRIIAFIKTIVLNDYNSFNYMFHVIKRNSGYYKVMLDSMKKLKFLTEIETINPFDNHFCYNKLRLSGITYNIKLKKIIVMKRRMFITLFGVLFLMFGFAACTEDDNAAYNVPKSINKKTRAEYTITYDDIQARIDELRIKYDSEWIINVNRKKPISYYTEQYFLLVENILRKDAGLEPLEKSSTSFHND